MGAHVALTPVAVVNLNPFRTVVTMHTSCSDITKIVTLFLRCNYTRRMMLIIRRGAMSVQRNIVALLRNYCCREKAINITYSECEFVALVTQHPRRMSHIVVCDLSVF